MQVAVAAAGVGADGEDLLGAHRQGAGGALQLRLLVGVAPPLPGDEHAVLAQQRRGELGERREAADRAGRDRVVGLAARPGRELLRAGVDDLGVARSPRRRRRGG